MEFCFETNVSDVYEFTEGIINTCLKIAKDAHVKKNNNAIYGVQKLNRVEMRSMIFDTVEELKAKVEELEVFGFKVHFVIRR